MSSKVATSSTGSKPAQMIRFRFYLLNLYQQQKRKFFHQTLPLGVPLYSVSITPSIPQSTHRSIYTAYSKVTMDFVFPQALNGKSLTASGVGYCVAWHSAINTTHPCRKVQGYRNVSHFQSLQCLMISTQWSKPWMWIWSPWSVKSTSYRLRRNLDYG